MGASAGEPASTTNCSNPAGVTRVSRRAVDEVTTNACGIRRGRTARVPGPGSRRPFRVVAAVAVPAEQEAHPAVEDEEGLVLTAVDVCRPPKRRTS